MARGAGPWGALRLRGAAAISVGWARAAGGGCGRCCRRRHFVAGVWSWRERAEGAGDSPVPRPVPRGTRRPARPTGDLAIVCFGE